MFRKHQSQFMPWTSISTTCLQSIQYLAVAKLFVVIPVNSLWAYAQHVWPVINGHTQIWWWVHAPVNNNMWVNPSSGPGMPQHEKDYKKQDLRWNEDHFVPWNFHQQCSGNLPLKLYQPGNKHLVEMLATNAYNKCLQESFYHRRWILPQEAKMRWWVVKLKKGSQSEKSSINALHRSCLIRSVTLTLCFVNRSLGWVELRNRKGRKLVEAICRLQRVVVIEAKYKSGNYRHISPIIIC